MSDILKLIHDDDPPSSLYASWDFVITRPGKASEVGRRMWDQIDLPPEHLFAEVARATLLSLGKWG